MDTHETRVQTGFIHSIESAGLVDGPGVRTIVFFQGCPLRCLYCHNPDSQPAFRGTTMSVDEIVALAQRYKSYYGEEGGVTISGGEPFMQGEFLLSVLMRLKEEGFNTCVDTSGIGDPRWYRKCFPYIDTLLLDIKDFSQEAFNEICKGRFSQLLEFMDAIAQQKCNLQIWIRHVMVPGRTDSEEAMDMLVETIMPVAPYVDRIEILPYHTMGVEKYHELGISYELEGVEPMDTKRARELQRYAQKRFAQRFKEERELSQPVKSPRQGSHMNKTSHAHAATPGSYRLQDLALFEGMTPEELVPFEDRVSFKTISKGEYAFKTGDPATQLYVICEGHIKIFYNSAEGKEQILYVYNPGDFVGGLNVMEEEDYWYMGEALDTCTLAIVPKDVFMAFGMTNNKILRKMLQKSYDRIRWSEDLIARLSSSNTFMKVAGLLLQLKDEFGVETPEGIRITLPMNREEMGSYSGLTRETMTRKLGELKDMGCLKYQGSKVVIITDIEMLKNFSF